jgi:acyl-CoA hydrolase
MTERIRRSETTQTRIIFADVLNDRGILFGGEAMKWMDEVAYITATRFLRQESVTVSVENIRFLFPVTQGSIIDVVGKIAELGRVKVKVQVEMLVADKFTDQKQKAVEATFWFAAVDENQNPVRIEFSEKQEELKN